jgi:hypothetical protein
MIISDDSSVINELETSLINDARVVIYDSRMLIVQATDDSRLNDSKLKTDDCHQRHNFFLIFIHTNLNI